MIVKINYVKHPNGPANGQHLIEMGSNEKSGLQQR